MVGNSTRAMLFALGANLAISCPLEAWIRSPAGSCWAYIEGPNFSGRNTSTSPINRIIA